MNDTAFERHSRQLLFAWVALLALMLASLASAYVPLGPGNAFASLGIAILKSAIVVGLFMRLARAPTIVRIAAATSLATWLLLIALSGVDEATRPHAPAAVQPARQTPAASGAEAR
ncbi:cytochrome C oxidase subunit IV family protein [Variovorax soli]|uniref:Cytochrome c oxidase subunit 4 n=1 Tax=Variovorax soli TaxID=376815 RepID=A0ABU1NEN4_9BURK|nr:cytochrome C oxidase subunit IV family protein [Variovorax soli]MDR6536531.1 cytochrome c oxidase subunit 4 [Variovorax soli]